MRSLSLLFLLLFTFVFVVACSSVPAPVDHRQQPPSRKISTHVVGKGETLFSIAWRYGLEYRGLARANGIGSSYTIHPGQIIKLTDNAADIADTASTSVRKNTTVINKPSITATPAIKPAVKSMGEGEVRWQWPVTGKIIQKFSGATNANKGIDLAGNLEEPVLAASSGKVVYAGGGLLGYGLLIIIKHNDRYLSAYAHNRELLVKEGDSVKAGGKIATMGSSGTDRVKLHFEIRRDGKPVDPEAYLPRR
jgi:lipoprotein NlpD